MNNLKTYSVIFIFLIFQFYCLQKAFALTGNYGVHDPSTIIKDGNKYYTFSTSKNITITVSTDLFKWTQGNVVFAQPPAWIKTIVPNWNGDYWAPECIYLNKKYYLYYSCSFWGSPNSVIGLTTNVTLDANNKNYKWVDEGMVLSSSSNKGFNAIDPAIFKDDNGKLYLTYGSYFNGIAIVNLDVHSGKPLPTAVYKKVAGGNGEDWEASYLFKNKNHYYLVANRGYCCSGLLSSYFITVGRSLNPTGPFVDENNVDMNAGGGKHLISSSGKYLGPGHFGFLRESNINFVSMHYYDANDEGHSKLDIAMLKFTDGWPVITRDWIAPGRFKIISKETNMVWSSDNCQGNKSELIAQKKWENSLCQKWDFASVGDGVYKIVSALKYHAVDVPSCNASQGTQLQTWDWLNNNCQKFKIDRTADGAYIFTSLTGSNIIEVPSHSAINFITQLGEYNGSDNQKWFINYPVSSANSISK